MSVRSEVDIIGQVIEERKRQDEKWGPQDHTPHYWLSILLEEAGEAAKAMIADTVDWQKYRKELVQVAAVAVAAVENLDAQIMAGSLPKELFPR